MGSRIWLKRAGAGLAVAAVGGAAALYMLPGRSKRNATTTAGRHSWEKQEGMEGDWQTFGEHTI